MNSLTARICTEGNAGTYSWVSEFTGLDY